MNRTRFIALSLALLLMAGCSTPSGSSSGSSSAVSSSAQGSTPGTGVQADWSKLEQEKPVRQADKDSGRWYAGAMTDLISSEEYGPLIPYTGSIVYSFNSWTDQNGQEQTYYSSWGTPLYGLMTREGKLVTDPIYLSASQTDLLIESKGKNSIVLGLDLVFGQVFERCEGAGHGSD